MDKYKKLLASWCDYLIFHMRKDGGFDCESCETVHGRADNAIYPLVLQYSLSGDIKYLDAAEKLLDFRALLSHEDGSVQNDFGSEWKGITVFSAINLMKTVKHFNAILPVDFLSRIEFCGKNSAKWVFDNIGIGFRSNINYYAAASTVNALYADIYSDERYKEKSSELLKYCLSHFTENGLLTGEGQPHSCRTDRGCMPVDIGYNVEESLPCLVETAILLGDNEALKCLTKNARRLLEFMLPDGGWDNSFGVRNNKWTYYGSRTSDGVIGAFTALGKYDSVFYEAAERTFEILNKCTHKGALYGGPGYFENGQKPCIHHSFCHAAALADAIILGIKEPENRQVLPCDSNTRSVKYYPEIASYKINIGSFLSTVTAYDYSTYTYNRGAAHSSGGTMSLLYKKGAGPLIAGSVFEYKLTEPFNMQEPANVRHESLIIRAECDKNGVLFASCLDKNARIEVEETKECIIIRAEARPVSIDGTVLAGDDAICRFTYRFFADKVEIAAKKTNENIRFIVPVINGNRTVSTENKAEREDIFFLTGGFSAEKFSFSMTEDINLTII